MPFPSTLFLAEKRDAQRSAPDRVYYDPKRNGLAPWMPVSRKVGGFSRPMGEGEFLENQERARVEQLMTRFGLGPGGNGEMTDSRAVVGLEGEVD